MCRRLNLEVTESAEYLKQAYIKEHDTRRKERLHMLYFYKGGGATERRLLVRLTGRSGPTLTAWFDKYRQGGLDALLERGTGGHRPPAIHPAAMKELGEKLDLPRGFSALSVTQS